MRAPLQASSIDLPFSNPAEQIKAVLVQYSSADSWLPLSANHQPPTTNHQDMVVLMHKDSAEVVAILDLRPWN